MQQATWLVHRSGWGARPPLSVLSTTVATKAIVHRVNERILSHEECPGKVRALQALDLEMGSDDIFFHALTCPHGFVFEGRSRLTPSPFSDPAEASVCYFGRTLDEQGLLGLSRAGFWLDLPLIPHNQVAATPCPGEEICSWLSRNAA